MQVEHSRAGIAFSKARSHRLRMEAFRLIYDRYHARGLIMPNPAKMRVAYHQTLETTEIFVALAKDRVVGTVSVACDSLARLPIDAVFPELCVRLRRRRLKLAEAFCFAAVPSKPARSKSVMAGLTSALREHLSQEGVERLLIAIHPRHAGFYQRRLGFVPWGEVRCHPLVRDNPAVACVLDCAKSSPDTPVPSDAVPRPLIERAPFLKGRQEFSTEQALLRTYCINCSSSDVVEPETHAE